MQIIKGLITAVFIALSTSIHAIELSIDQSQRYSRLIHQYRCVVCQNQSLAESDNVVSDSLRLKIKNLIVENKTDEQIDRYLKDRYGDHVSYQPPINFQTLLLWLLPLMFIINGIRLFLRR